MTAGLFYIQHKGYVGNSLIWWRRGGSGYTCNLDEAWQVTEAEAKQICRDRPEQDIPWPTSQIDSIAQRHVDMQDLPKVHAPAAAPKEKRCPNCKSVVRGHPNKKFCGQRCKDRYHNVSNPRGYFAHLNPARPEYARGADFNDDPSWDAHKSY